MAGCVYILVSEIQINKHLTLLWYLYMYNVHEDYSFVYSLHISLLVFVLQSLTIFPWQKLDFFTATFIYAYHLLSVTEQIFRYFDFFNMTFLSEGLIQKILEFLMTSFQCYVMLFSVVVHKRNIHFILKPLYRGI